VTRARVASDPASRATGKGGERFEEWRRDREAEGQEDKGIRRHGDRRHRSWPLAARISGTEIFWEVLRVKGRAAGAAIVCLGAKRLASNDLWPRWRL
jgi:hypothetical protein